MSTPLERGYMLHQEIVHHMNTRQVDYLEAKVYVLSTRLGGVVEEANKSRQVDRRVEIKHLAGQLVDARTRKRQFDFPSEDYQTAMRVVLSQDATLKDLYAKP